MIESDWLDGGWGVVKKSHARNQYSSNPPLLSYYYPRWFFAREHGNLAICFPGSRIVPPKFSILKNLVEKLNFESFSFQHK